VNLPLAKIFDPTAGTLHSVEKLATVFGASGIGSDVMPVFYDEYDGQNAAMEVWALEYLGHDKVQLVSVFLPELYRQGFEKRYKPVSPKPANLSFKPNYGIRSAIEDIQSTERRVVLDVRSADEFSGASTSPNLPRPGHIPGAFNVPWTEFLGDDNHFFTEKDVQLNDAKESARVITYCNSGPRAALAYVALKKKRYENVSVYDRSFAEWSNRPELPVEVHRGTNKS
jgi:thiosulfate/3-mercaptopyruvate sulfurtransferase